MQTTKLGNSLKKTEYSRDQKVLISYETVITKYNECVFVFLPQLSGIQIASFLRSMILSSVACLAVPYFPALSHKRHDFGKEGY